MLDNSLKDSDCDTISFIFEETGYVKKLPGFIKDKHTVPKEISPYHNKWIKSLANAIVENEINHIYKSLTVNMNCKRKDILSPVMSDGYGKISTSGFSCTIEINQSKIKSGVYVLTKTLSEISSVSTIHDESFNKVFYKTFNKLEISGTDIINIENIIDRVEDYNCPEIIRVEYNITDMSKCKLLFRGIPEPFYIDESSLVIAFNANKSPLEVLEYYEKLRIFLTP